MKKYRRLICLCLFLFLSVFLFSLPVAAEDAETRIKIDIPRELREYLPSGVGGFTPTEIMDTFDFHFFTRLGIRILAESAPEAAKSFALLLGLMLLSAVLTVIRRTVSSAGLQTAMELVSLVCVASAVFAVTEGVFSLAEGFVSSLASFMRQITPVMAGFMIASGEITSAAVVSGVIFTAISLLESIVAELLFPMIRLSLCLSLVSSIFGVSGLSGVAPMLKKSISYVFGFVTLCLSAVLMFQRMIAKSTDSLAMRGIKFAVGQFVPFVGGAVNEALSTIIGGIGTIKAGTGVLAAVTVTLIAAVPLIKILLQKMFLEMISVCAGILGLSGENRLMSEVASFLGYTAAVVAISGVFFLLSISMMASLG